MEGLRSRQTDSRDVSRARCLDPDAPRRSRSLSSSMVSRTCVAITPWTARPKKQGSRFASTRHIRKLDPAFQCGAGLVGVGGLSDTLTELRRATGEISSPGEGTATRTRSGAPHLGGVVRARHDRPIVAGEDNGVGSRGPAVAAPSLDSKHVRTAATPPSHGDAVTMHRYRPILRAGAATLRSAIWSHAGTHGNAP